MKEIIQKIENTDWQHLTETMHENGYAVIPNLLSDHECEILKSEYDHSALYRKTVVMARHRFGLGEYKYFNYPLPEIIQAIRTGIYPHLAPIANSWFNALHIDIQFPLNHQEFLQQCHVNGQRKATILILKYTEGGFNTLHQDLYGEHVFPLQVEVLLSEPGKDFTGGEFVLTEQRPRMQSRVEVVPLRQGDAVAFAVHNRPVKGSKGHYRVNLRHGVSRLRTGRRHTLGIIFHDAK